MRRFEYDSPPKWRWITGQCRRIDTTLNLASGDQDNPVRTRRCGARYLANRLIEGVRGWWNDGWRVIARETDHMEITVHGDFATARRVVKETYRGPKGGLLLRVNTRPLEP